MGLTRPRFSQFDTTISSISDPITVLNKSSTLANVDVGFIINRNSGALANTAIFWNESANTFALAFTTNSGEVPNANIAISEYANLKINALTADTAVFSSTGAIKIPSGNTLQRTSGTTGQIRFNTSTSQFEGYQGASWSSLGGVRSVDNATYIIAEQYPGAGNNILYFYTNNTLQATVSSTGINLAGNVLATTGTFNTLTVNGNESVTGYLNVTGNIIATTATVGTVEAAGMIYANSATNSTSTTTGALRVAGGIGVVGNIWADRIHAGNNGNGTNFKVGDDLWLGDINVANTMRLMGAQDNTQAFIRFGNTNTSTLGVSGSGPLSWGGVLNVTGNILGATASFGAINSTGYINTTANLSAAVINAGSIGTVGAVTSTGFINTSGNVSGAVVLAGSLTSTGFINTSGNVSGAVVLAGSLTSTGFINTSGNVSGAVVLAGSLTSTGFINTSGNVSAAIGSFNSITVRAAVTAIANGGTSGVGNIGATGATFNTVFAKATTAQYADLAEVYTSDQQYPGGTVVVFGGESEVTQSHSSHDIRIAGVVSTNPAYLMNHDAVGVPVALQGRVPCRVLGPVSKGDRVVASHIAGVAQVLDPQQYQPGCIIGKALQAIDSTDILVIEVVVGRL
jgi:hypothetical protein